MPRTSHLGKETQSHMNVRQHRPRDISSLKTMKIKCKEEAVGTVGENRHLDPRERYSNSGRISRKVEPIKADLKVTRFLSETFKTR